MRRLVAYLGPSPSPLPIESALTIYSQTPQTQIDFKGLGYVTGIDTNMDGSPGTSPAVHGLAIEPPADLGDLTSNYAVDDPSRITGGAATQQIQLTDKVRIHYSSEAIRSISILGSGAGKYILFNGWQEIAR